MRADLSTASPSHIHSQARFIPRKAPEGKQKVYFSKHPQLGTGRAGGNKTYSKQRSFPGRRISQSSGGMQNSCTNSPGASPCPREAHQASAADQDGLPSPALLLLILTPSLIIALARLKGTKIPQLPHRNFPSRPVGSQREEVSQLTVLNS